MENFRTERFEKALDLYNKEDFAGLFEFCKKEAPFEVNNIELWKLFSIGAGMTNHSQVAVMACETVFSLESEHFGNFLNLITTYFHNDQGEEAIELIHAQKHQINPNNIQFIIDLIIEASNQYDQNDLIRALPEPINELIQAKIKQCRAS